MQQLALRSRTGPHDVPLTRWQQRKLAALRLLFSEYEGRVLRVPHLEKPLDVSQCLLSVRCEGFGERLRVDVVLRQSAATGLYPSPPAMWTGKDRVFGWECPARGKDRWIGDVPVALLAELAK